MGTGPATASNPGVAVAEDAELRQWKLEHISTAGAHVLGRRSYTEMSAFWPQSSDAYAAPMNEIPKVVFSTTVAGNTTT
jgi:dihydrofolate reductase